MSTDARVVRLGAWCDVEDVTWQMRAEGHPMRSFTADVREHADLADGTRLVLRAGLGWSSTLRVHDGDAVTVSGDPWDHLTEDDLRRQALITVLPDMGNDDTDPVEDHPYDELAELLADHGVHVTPDELRALPHDVELGPRLTSHFGHDNQQGPVG